VSSNRRLIVNLSALMEKPTGLSVYAANVVPRLAEFEPIVLLRESLVESWASKYPGLRLEAIRDDLSADSGAKGHARRLTWVETVLSKRLRRTADPVLFSPVPEAPFRGSVPTVVTVFDFIPRLFYPATHPLYRYTRHYVPRVLRRATRVLAISDATARDAVVFGGIDRSKIDVTPLACDTEHFRPLGLERKPYFLYLGRCAPYKNVELALRGFADAAIEGFEFVMAGPPDPGFDDLLREFRDRRGVQVRFVPYPSYESLPRLLNEATALIFPSRYEGFGLPILEAMACGTPVVTSDVSSMPEVAGGAATLVGPNDAHPVSEAMIQLAHRGEHWLDLSERGLVRASEFSWDSTGARTASVLRTLL
jgi:glycosyltransferase involved in cell wall biosynthesis